MLLCFFIYYSFQLVKNIQTHRSPATELFEVLVWPVIITTIDFLLKDFLLKTCASEYMQITVPFCPQLQPDSLFFTRWIANFGDQKYYWSGNNLSGDTNHWQGVTVPFFLHLHFC